MSQIVYAAFVHPTLIVAYDSISTRIVSPQPGPALVNSSRLYLGVELSQPFRRE
jgi:hypothetical protein